MSEDAPRPPETSRSDTGRGPDISRLLPQNSFGLKLLLVCALALAMAIPAGFVWMLVYARSSDANNAAQEVAQMQGGPQILSGPVLVVPYDRDVVVETPGTATEGPRTSIQTTSGFISVHAETGSAATRLETSLLKRGLQRVPVFLSDTHFEARFNAERASAVAPDGARLRWSDSVIYLAMSDLRGAKEATLSAGGEPVDLSPYGGSEVSSGSGASLTYQNLVGGPVPWLDDPARRQFSATGDVRMSGAQRVALAPFARDTDLSLTATGPGATPSFDGGAAPEQRDVREDGFSASWKVPYLARSAPGAGVNTSIDPLLAAAPGVTLINSASPYQAVERALKYAPMFLGLVFLTYFLFETRMKRRAHPAQYVLVGLAQLVFYLLLLSVSEILGFNLGFLTAATGTVLAISLYAGSVFRSTGTAAVALGVFSALYCLIFLLMRMEDYALLAGSLACFLAIIATMWMTRNLDWYGPGRLERAGA